LTLHSVTPLGAVIESPDGMQAVYGIIIVRGATNVTIDGFDISGPGLSGNSHAIESGILIDNGGSAVITNNLIEHIHDSPLSPAQNGVGIAVGATYTYNNAVQIQYGRATILNNTIIDYQKGGIFVDGYNSFATIGTGGTSGINGGSFSNTITGAGGTPLLAQFGIQVSNRAGADIENNFIQNNLYTGPGFKIPTFAAGFGIIMSSLTSGRTGPVVVNGNSMFNNDEGLRAAGLSLATINNNLVFQTTVDGIDLANVYGSKVTGNVVQFAGFDGMAFSGNSFANTISGNNSVSSPHDGIFLTATTYNNTLTANDFGGSNFDAEDRSVGSGTAATANTWSGNIFANSSKNPPGIN
jgi:hypothetical protein